VKSGEIVGVLVGLLPVIAFLAALVSLDSYKLVKLPLVAGTVGVGALAAVASYASNGAVLSHLAIDWSTFSRYVAPLIEEVLKGLIVLALIRTGRIAFLVDAAIFGFAAGTGFSVLENIYYSLSGIAQQAGIGTWIIRGFGTAIMHGGATAIFGVASLSFLERAGVPKLLAPAPGLEVGWRMVRAAWGHGYATEAARAALADVFARADAAEVISFTLPTNTRSLAVMARLGLDRDASRDFTYETGLPAVVFVAPRSRYAAVTEGTT